MKLSKFTLVYKNKDKYILANTLTKGIIRLEEEAYNDLFRSEETLTFLTPAQYRKCKEMGFLVEDNLNEENQVRFALERKRLGLKQMSLYFTFSTNCNFACKYCYELGQVEYMSMTDSVVNGTIDWVEEQAKRESLNKVIIYLYGGEPLLYKKEMVSFLCELKQRLSVLNVDLFAQLVTNGTLIDKDTINELMQCGLREVHISIDGTEQIHNDHRPYKNGKGSYSDIISSIELLKNNFPNLTITCRVGIDNSSTDEALNILDVLASYNENNNIYPYFAAITNTTEQMKSETSYCNQNVASKKELVRIYKLAFAKMKKLGFKLQDFFTVGPCMAVSANSFAVYPNGDIYSCLDMIGHETEKVGNVFDFNLSARYYDFCRAKHLEKCYKSVCEYLPICGGGCLLKQFLNSEGYDKPDCPKKLLKEMNKATILAKYGD